jgi:hypothetical protein
MIFSCTQWNWPLNSIYGIEQVLTCVFLFDFVLSPSSYLRLIVSSFFLLHSCCIQFVSFWNCFDSCLHTLLFGIPRTLLSCASQSFFSFRLDCVLCFWWRGKCYGKIYLMNRGVPSYL